MIKKHYGLLGKNINYSFSPILHKEIFEVLKKNYDYSLIDIERDKIENLINDIRKNKLQGINVTIPYKEEIMPHLDYITPKAKKIGAVNTVYRDNKNIIGDNTDYDGFLKTIERMNLDIKNKNIAILGSGGSAKAILQVVNDLFGIPYIVSRNKEDTQQKFKNIKVINYKELEDLKGYLIINCTPLGNKNNPDLSPVPKKICENWKFAIDLNYIPEISTFLSYFEPNHRSNGLYMLVSQGVQSQIIWQNKNIALNEIYDIIYKKVYCK